MPTRLGDNSYSNAWPASLFLLLLSFPQAFLQNKEKEILRMSEQLEAQLAGMGSGALSEVGGPLA